MSSLERLGLPRLQLQIPSCRETTAALQQQRMPGIPEVAHPALSTPRKLGIAEVWMAFGLPEVSLPALVTPASPLQRRFRLAVGTLASAVLRFDPQVA